MTSAVGPDDVIVERSVKPISGPYVTARGPQGSNGSAGQQGYLGSNDTAGPVCRVPKLGRLQSFVCPWRPKYCGPAAAVGSGATQTRSRAVLLRAASRAAPPRRRSGSLRRSTERPPPASPNDDERRLHSTTPPTVLRFASTHAHTRERVGVAMASQGAHLNVTARRLGPERRRLHDDALPRLDSTTAGADMSGARAEHGGGGRCGERSTLASSWKTTAWRWRPGSVELDGVVLLEEGGGARLDP